MNDNHNDRDRRHPHRFAPDAYWMLWQAVRFTVCTKDRRPELTRRGIPEVLVEALDHNATNNGCEIIAYCIMPDHLHVMACVAQQGGDLIALIDGFKKRTGRALRQMGASFPVWQRNYWDRHARSDRDLAEAIEYILMNPVRKGLCLRPEDWPHSEFRGYPWDR